MGDQLSALEVLMLALRAMLDDSLDGTLKLSEQEGSRLWSVESGTHTVTSVPACASNAPTQAASQAHVQYVASSVVLVTYQESDNSWLPSVGGQSRR
jgi:hypothetical protein